MNQPIRILLIDDDLDDKVLFIEALADIDETIDCEYYNNGEQALRWLTTTGILPDYIFLDLNMPKMNGIEVLKAIKSDRRISAIPVIIYSTSRNDLHQLEVKKMGAALYIIKPYSLADLKNEIVLAMQYLQAKG
jgi:CheY-like chemotaxis protein